MIGELYMKKDANSASSMPYSGVGRFFSPDGDLDETAFRNFLLDSIKGMNLEGLDAQKKAGRIGRWLTEYLSELFDYLEEKGMGMKSVRLFRLAMDVAADYHINNVTLPMRHMKNILQNVEESPVKPEKKVAKDKKREAIFAAALKVFAEKGYHRATIDEIASLSGIGKGSVYRYFRSKEDLLKQLIYAKDDEILQSIRAIFAYDEDILVQLQKMITVWIEFIEDNYVVYNLVQNDSIRQIVGDGVMFYDYFITQPAAAEGEDPGREQGGGAEDHQLLHGLLRHHGIHRRSGPQVVQARHVLSPAGRAARDIRGALQRLRGGETHWKELHHGGAALTGCPPFLYLYSLFFPEFKIILVWQKFHILFHQVKTGLFHE
jgi:AcrR family transcriptional regulator